MAAFKGRSEVSSDDLTVRPRRAEAPNGPQLKPIDDTFEQSRI
jgi:hypothetical protein